MAVDAWRQPQQGQAAGRTFPSDLGGSEAKGGTNPSLPQSRTGTCGGRCQAESTPGTAATSQPAPLGTGARCFSVYIDMGATAGRRGALLALLAGVTLQCVATRSVLAALGPTQAISGALWCYSSGALRPCGENSAPHLPHAHRPPPPGSTRRAAPLCLLWSMGRRPGPRTGAWGCRCAWRAGCCVRDERREATD